MCLGGDKGAGAGRMSVLCVLLCWTSTCVSHRGADVMDAAMMAVMQHSEERRQRRSSPPLCLAVLMQHKNNEDEEER